MQRNLLALFTLAALALVAIFGAPLLAPTPTQAQNMSKIPAVGRFMSVADAHKKALAKELILIDIRTSDEWKDSGVPASATPLTMHQSAARFFGGLDRLTLFDKSKPIALICATGVRTTFLQKILRKEGYSNIINVAEGMYGSKFGPGWLKAGLPVKRYTGAKSSTPPPSN